MRQPGTQPRNDASGRDPPDEILMEQYASGDEQAFGELFRRWEPRAYAFFLRRTGSPERSQDLYQELFLRVHRARNRYDPGRPFAPWFFQIAARLWVDDARRSFRNSEVTMREEELPLSSSEGEAPEGREELALLLRELSAEERYVLASRIDGADYSELGAQLGKSVGAVRKMVSRAVQRLRLVAFQRTDVSIPGR